MITPVVISHGVVRSFWTTYGESSDRANIQENAVLGNASLRHSLYVDWRRALRKQGGASTPTALTGEKNQIMMTETNFRLRKFRKGPLSPWMQWTSPLCVSTHNKNCKVMQTPRLHSYAGHTRKPLFP